MTDTPDPFDPFDHDSGGRLADGADEDADEVQGVEGEEDRDDAGEGDDDAGLPPEGDDPIDGAAPTG